VAIPIGLVRAFTRREMGAFGIAGPPVGSVVRPDDNC
jgi:hypothetical protein